MPSGLSGGKVRSKATDTNSNSGSNLLLAGEFQCTTNSIPAPHIVQSGSYVEILKHAAPQPPNNQPNNQQTAMQAPNAKRPSGVGAGLGTNNGSNNVVSGAALACHNKSYGDFLTITPRRKGKLLSSGYGDKHGGAGSGAGALDGSNQDNYRHHLPTSIEPLHLLGIPNDNMSTFFDYRAMETLSNSDTLAIGSSLSGHAHNNRGNKAYDTSTTCLNANNYGESPQSNSNSGIPDEFHNIISEKNLSPPSAFSDNNSCLPKGKV